MMTKIFFLLLWYFAVMMATFIGLDHWYDGWRSWRKERKKKTSHIKWDK